MINFLSVAAFLFAVDAARAQTQVILPHDQASFILDLKALYSRQASAQNPVEKKYEFEEGPRKFCEGRSLEFKNWVGRVKDIFPYAGDYSVIILIDKDIVLKNHIAGSATDRVDPKSEAAFSLSKINIGDIIYFSGVFSKGRSMCINDQYMSNTSLEMKGWWGSNSLVPRPASRRTSEILVKFEGFSPY